ncbi:MAG: beta-lactamase family protein [Alphaproteobacteria bacterium]|nr:beta-lactamase family protein [Alphaproteobacteria bacterium]
MTKDPRMMPSKAHYNGWRDPDSVRWHLRNMSTLPALIMPRGGPVFELETGAHKDVENVTYDYQGRTLTLGEAMREDCIDGYIVIQNGEVLFERYYDNFSAHDHHIWFSMTKSLISTAFGIAQVEFGIDESKSPADFIPELADSVFADVSIRHVLNMVTALNYTEEYDEMTPGTVHFEYFRRLGFMGDFELLAIDPNQSDEPRGVRDMLPRFEQASDGTTGAMFQYQSPNVDVIGWLIERITGRALMDYMREKLWVPMATEHDGVFTVDVSFAPVATGGFNSTLRDAARFGLMALGDGMLGDTQVAPESWIKDTYAMTAEDNQAGAASVNSDPEHERFIDGFSGYRSFWWQFDQSQGERLAMGVHGQVIYVNKAKNLVIANFASPAQTANQLRASYKQMLFGTRALAASL